jgi:hypothetical protein
MRCIADARETLKRGLWSLPNDRARGFAARLPGEVTAIRRAVVSVKQFIVENGNCIFK